MNNSIISHIFYTCNNRVFFSFFLYFLCLAFYNSNLIYLGVYPSRSQRSPHLPGATTCGRPRPLSRTRPAPPTRADAPPTLRPRSPCLTKSSPIASCLTHRRGGNKSSCRKDWKTSLFIISWTWKIIFRFSWKFLTRIMRLMRFDCVLFVEYKKKSGPNADSDTPCWNEWTEKAYFLRQDINLFVSLEVNLLISHDAACILLSLNYKEINIIYPVVPAINCWSCDVIFVLYYYWFWLLHIFHGLVKVKGMGFIRYYLFQW